MVLQGLAIEIFLIHSPTYQLTLAYPTLFPEEGLLITEQDRTNDKPQTVNR
jgi:hypothetical protein